MAGSGTPSIASAIEQILRESTVHANLAQELIFTTKDRLKLCLIGHQEIMQVKQGWAVPLGVLVPVLLALATADFKDLFGVRADSWRAIFIIGSVISALWFIRDVIRALRTRGTSIDAIIEELKTSSPRTVTSGKTGGGE